MAANTGKASEKNDTAGKIDENIPFEKSLAELEDIVRKLESGETSLEDSINLYVRGSRLREHCEGKLKEARLKVEKIVRNEKNELATEEFDS